MIKPSDPFYAFFKLIDFLVFLRFPEDVQVLVGDQEEIVLAPPPLACRLHLPLHLYDVLAQDEAGIQEGLQDPWSNRNEVLVPSGVAYEDGAVLARLEHAVALLRHLPHFLGELCNIMHA